MRTRTLYSHERSAITERGDGTHMLLMWAVKGTLAEPAADSDLASGTTTLWIQSKDRNLLREKPHGLACLSPRMKLPTGSVVSGCTHLLHPIREHRSRGDNPLTGLTSRPMQSLQCGESRHPASGTQSILHGRRTEEDEVILYQKQVLLAEYMHRWTNMPSGTCTAVSIGLRCTVAQPTEEPCLPIYYAM